MALDSEQLLKMSKAELDALFRASESGPVPNGAAQGTALIAPGTAFNPEVAEFVKLFAWQGKTFDAAAGTLLNRVSPLGVNAIHGNVYIGPSWLDEKPCVVLDYSKTSTIAHWIRDELREVAPKLYLGIVFWERVKVFDFCLQF